MSTSQPAPDTALPALTLAELTRPSSGQTERLLELAGQIYAVKPWQKLEEDAIFVVRNPADDALLFVGTIGGSGEQAGVIVYRGTESYFGLLDFLERAGELPAIPQMAEGAEAAEELMSMLADALSQANFNPMELMQLPQLQLMFEPREALEEPDEAWIARHNYAATGAGFPTFRAVSSGFLPWWVSDVEADALIIALEQLLELVNRADFSLALLEIKEVDYDDDFTFELFARISQNSETGARQWRDERLIIEPPTATEPSKIVLNDELVARINALPASAESIEVALLGMSSPYGDAQTRPFFPTLLLLGHEGQVVANEMLGSGFGDALPPQIADALAILLAERPTRPQKLQFSSPDLEILNLVGAKLGIQIELAEELKTLDPALEIIAEQMENFDADDLSDEEWAEMEASGS